eukprot:TRINITY_DN66043_c14_g5_i1.p1 TRINITY_DN66043_c14_g5~~TRINITY_DN66043_c14_g5_i1.p1  ORF type:complete len:852 (+),score=421.74 TRINITY_DN66043_c14_g5_i1:85-2640(+)
MSYPRFQTTAGGDVSISLPGAGTPSRRTPHGSPTLSDDEAEKQGLLQNRRTPQAPQPYLHQQHHHPAAHPVVGMVPSQLAGGRDKRAEARADAERSKAQYMWLNRIAIAICGISILFSLGALRSRGLYLSLVLVICVGSFFLAQHLMLWILNKEGDRQEMLFVWEAIKEGADAFMGVQFVAIAKIAVVVGATLFAIYLWRDSPVEGVSQLTMASITTGSFLMGAFCSGLAGYIGLWVSVRVNVRVAVAAARYDYPNSMLLAFRGGAVSSILSAALCIVGLSFLYVFCHIVFVNYYGVAGSHVPILLSGYGFGASFVALFAAIGGGLYTKSADVGADMVGKIEQNIPEDDPRNPAVIADLVGDNVGDTSSSLADVFESISAEIIGTMILGSTLAHEAKIENAEAYIFFPLVVHAFDLVVSSFGIMTMQVGKDIDPIRAMKRSYVVSMALAVVGFTVTCWLLLSTDVAPDAWKHFAGCGAIGIVSAYLLTMSTEYYTDYAYSPVLRIASASKTGHGTNVIAGLAVGMESTAIPVVVICCALFGSYTLGRTSGLPAASAGVFGTAVATMGMLCTAVYVLAMNNFGPIADNAGGIVEMSEQPEGVRKITDQLDACGNVTKASAKGFAVGGSALACFVLFQAFLDEVSAFAHTTIEVINIAQVELVIGALIGVMLIFLFTGWTIQGVADTAQQVVWEVRRQFRERPGIMDGSQRPDYGTCVAIVTRAALRCMIKPAALALGTPVLVGFAFKYVGMWTDRPMLGIEVVASFLMFATLTGLVMSMFLDNSGGAWDNAKKYIEKGQLRGTLQHQASVTGDCVGDPLKDTAGPSLHVIITTMSTTVLVLGPMFMYRPDQS